jgi:hypothetical protein
MASKVADIDQIGNILGTRAPIASKVEPSERAQKTALGVYTTPLRTLLQLLEVVAGID